MKYLNNGILHLEDYMHFLQIERQLANNTLTSYKKDLIDYLHHIFEVQQLHSLNEIERTHIVLYLRSLKENGKSARTISRHISSIRSFHQFY